MAQTPQSQASSYLPANEFLNRYDARSVGDLCSDSGTRLSSSQLLTGNSGGVNAILQALLDDASGILESACQTANRYLPADLSALTGVGQKLMYRIIADLAYGMLVQRRPDRNMPLPPQYKLSLDLLEKLRGGERIFSTVEAGNAGIAEDYKETETDVINRNGATFQAERLFGRRANRIGVGQSQANDSPL